MVTGRQTQKSVLGFSRRKLHYMLLAMFFLMTFGTFKFFPEMVWLNEMWLASALFFLALPFIYWKARGGWHFNSFELYLLGMMACIPIIASFASLREFGQPIIYGMLAQRGMLLATGALAIIFAFRKRWINTFDVERSLVFLAWLNLLFYILMNGIFDPAQFSEIRGLAAGVKIGEPEFTFDSTFIIFGLFYYSFIGFRQKSNRAVLLALPLLAYLIVLDGGRSMLLSVLASFLFYIYRWASFPRLMWLAPRVLGAVLLLVGMLVVMDSGFMSHLAGKFTDAFNVVLTGSETPDASANARIFESAVAYPYILKHWLIGNGDISYQWHGGYEGVLGAYFFPSDIGILGVLYMYGIVGTVMFGWQFWFAWHAARRLRKQPNSPLRDAIKGYLLYYAIHSLVTGRFVHLAQVGFVFIAILYGIIYEEQRKIAISRREALGAAQ